MIIVKELLYIVTRLCRFIILSSINHGILQTISQDVSSRSCRSQRRSKYYSQRRLRQRRSNLRIKHFTKLAYSVLKKKKESCKAEKEFLESYKKKVNGARLLQL
jgi:hypothetical protein